MAKSRKKWKIIIPVAAAVLILGAAAVWFFFFRGGGAPGSEGVAYVDTVANMMGISMDGSGNRFGGVVEAKESWSINTNPEMEVAEIFVEVGEEVEEGTPLFIYDTEKAKADLEQAQIDLQRLKNERDSINTTIGQLQKEKASAGSSQQADYTIQIQEQQLAFQQKGLDIQSKQTEIDTLKETIDNATVKSKIGGVVKSINKSGEMMDSGDNSFMTITQTDSFRIKGSVNEQNIGEIYEGCPVIVHSRTDDSLTWTGTVEKVDRENATSNNQGYYMDSGSDTSSSSYPFYVTLDSSEGLMLGQHVYLEASDGEVQDDRLWLDDYLIDLTDPEDPFVWADDGKGHLEKRKVKLGEYDSDMMRYVILSGLELTDKIAWPDETLTEGMTTVDMREMMDEMYAEDGAAMEDSYSGDNGYVEEEFLEEEVAD